MPVIVNTTLYSPAKFKTFALAEMIPVVRFESNNFKSAFDIAPVQASATLAGSCLNSYISSALTSVMIILFFPLLGPVKFFLLASI